MWNNPVGKSFPTSGLLWEKRKNFIDVDQCGLGVQRSRFFSTKRAAGRVQLWRNAPDGLQTLELSDSSLSSPLQGKGIATCMTHLHQFLI
jgi:hypothetical protein